MCLLYCRDLAHTYHSLSLPRFGASPALQLPGLQRVSILHLADPSTDGPNVSFVRDELEGPGISVVPMEHADLPDWAAHCGQASDWG